ncbi:MAG TPA: cytochrome P450 [Myxococcota bacterium]|nr:cytochrome P450 [Myxococcota bacterium]
MFVERARAPWIGVYNTIRYLRSPLAFLDAQRGRGDVVPLPFGPTRMWLLTDPADIHRVLVSEHRNFPKRHPFLELLKRVAGEGLATSDGEVWRRQRAAAQRKFHRDRVDVYAVDILDRLDARLATWRDGDERDLYAELMRVLLESIARSLFSSDVSGSADEVTGHVAEIMSWVASPLFLGGAIGERLPLPSARRFLRARAALRAIVEGHIEARRARDVTRPDLLGALLDVRQDDGAPLPAEQVRDEVFTLFVGGYEPGAVTLGWMFHLLGRHPEILAAAADEARATLGERLPERADLDRLPTLERVYRETLRLYPPAWSVGRSAVAPATFGGQEMPAGEVAWLSQWRTHRDGRWYDDPAAFRPDRWAGDLEARLPPGAWFPFGGGPRVCIGAALARVQVLSIAATVLARWRVEVRVDRPPTPLASVNLRPGGGVWARLTRR